MKWTLAHTSVTTVIGMLSLPIIILVAVLVFVFCGCNQQPPEQIMENNRQEILEFTSSPIERSVYVVGLTQFNATTNMYETVFNLHDPQQEVYTGYRMAFSANPPKTTDGKITVVLRGFKQWDGLIGSAFFAK